MEYRSVLWEDVVEGQELPPIVYELSLLRLVAFVRASGVYDYVHFDRDYAQAVGARDVFAATPHIAGLFSRLLTDWSGPEAEIRSITFSMRAQSCAGDILQITGKVGKKYRNERGDYLVDIVDMNIGHGLAPHAAVATATLALPSTEGGAVKFDAGAAPQAVTNLRDDTPDFARALIGKPKDVSSRPRPFTEDEILLWCEALEDWNPLYWDKEYATRSKHGGIIAPPLSLLYGAGASASVGIGYLKPGKQIPDAVRRGLTGMSLLQELRKDFVAANSPLSLPEYPEVVIADSRVEHYKAARPGDSVREVQEMVDCSAKKRTKLGEGYFMTWRNSEYNQKNELVKTVQYTMFCYHT